MANARIHAAKGSRARLQVAFAKHRQRGQPIHVRQADIAHEHVRRQRRRPIETRLGRPGYFNVLAAVFEKTRDVLRQRRFVLDHQQARRLRIRGGPFAGAVLLTAAHLIRGHRAGRFHVSGFPDWNEPSNPTSMDTHGRT